jgi:hypothetical protein
MYVTMTCYCDGIGTHKSIFMSSGLSFKTIVSKKCPSSITLFVTTDYSGGSTEYFQSLPSNGMLYGLIFK